MKFSILALLSIAASAVALPSPAADSMIMQRGDDHPEHIKFPVPDGVTIKQGAEKCGDQAQLSCCNKATYTGDFTQVDKGGGLLSNLIGAGSGSQGAGLFDQCSKLPLQVNIIAILNLQDILNQQCKQNIACCQKSGADASDDLIGAALPCVALGSIL